MSTLTKLLETARDTYKNIDTDFNNYVKDLLDTSSEYFNTYNYDDDMLDAIKSNLNNLLDTLYVDVNRHLQNSYNINGRGAKAIEPVKNDSYSKSVTQFTESNSYNVKSFTYDNFSMEKVSKGYNVYIGKYKLFLRNGDYALIDHEDIGDTIVDEILANLNHVKYDVDNKSELKVYVNDNDSLPTFVTEKIVDLVNTVYDTTVHKDDSGNKDDTFLEELIKILKNDDTSKFAANIKSLVSNHTDGDVKRDKVLTFYTDIQVEFTKLVRKLVNVNINYIEKYNNESDE
jgi:hypothetical protein